MASEEQRLTLELFAEGKNVIILGPGGTGKTYIIKKIAEYCEKHKINLKVAAYTGKAASLFKNGRTVNSLFGLGLGNKTAEEYIEAIKGNRWLLNAWRKFRIVVIDEISMLGLTLFDKIFSFIILVNSLLSFLTPLFKNCITELSLKNSPFSL